MDKSGGRLERLFWSIRPGTASPVEKSAASATHERLPVLAVCDAEVESVVRAVVAVVEGWSPAGTAILEAVGVRVARTRSSSCIQCV